MVLPIAASLLGVGVGVVVLVFLLLFAGVAFALTSRGSGIEAHPSSSQDAPGADRDSEAGA